MGSKPWEDVEFWQYARWETGIYYYSYLGDSKSLHRVGDTLRDSGLLEASCIDDIRWPYLSSQGSE